MGLGGALLRGVLSLSHDLWGTQEGIFRWNFGWKKKFHQEGNQLKDRVLEIFGGRWGTTLLETNIFALENGWLEDYFPIDEAYFQVQAVSFGEGNLVGFQLGANRELEISGWFFLYTKWWAKGCKKVLGCPVGSDRIKGDRISGLSSFFPHLLTIDPKFLGHPSKGIERQSIHFF